MKILRENEPKTKFHSEKDRIAIIKELKGICSHLTGGSEEFLYEKHKQIEQEERFWQSKVRN